MLFHAICPVLHHSLDRVGPLARTRSVSSLHPEGAEMSAARNECPSVFCTRSVPPLAVTWQPPSTLQTSLSKSKFQAAMVSGPSCPRRKLHSSFFGSSLASLA